MHLNFAEDICPSWPLILILFSFNATNRDKPSANRNKSAGNNKKSKSKDEPSANRKKSAGNNKESKPKGKLIANREELANDNNGNLDNKLSVNIKSLIGEKNID